MLSKFLWFVALGACVVGCGARTGIEDGPGRECANDGDCDDGVFCNGAEHCDLGRCRAGDAPDCDDDDPCTDDGCLEDEDRCLNLPIQIDEDGDGWNDVGCGGEDCDDGRADVHPDAPELCNDLDDDCDGEIDEPMAPRWIADADLEGGIFGQSLTWMDGEYAIAWHSAGSRSAPLMLGFLSSEGSFLREPEPMTATANESFGPSLTWTGSELCLTYNVDASCGAVDSINVLRFDDAGYRLGMLFGYTEGDFEHRNPHAAWTGRGYGLVYRLGHFGSGYSEIKFYALGTQVEFLVGPLSVADESADSYAPQIAWDGHNFAVAWIDEQDGEFTMRIAMLSAEGEIIEGPRALARSSTYAWSLNLVAVQGHYGVAWTELRYPFGAVMRYVEVDSLGYPTTDPAPLTTEADGSTTPVMLWADRMLAIAWVHYAGEVLPSVPAEVRFAWASPDGMLLTDPVSLSPGWSRSRRPAVAWDPEHRSAGLTWLDDLEDGEGVYFGRVCE